MESETFKAPGDPTSRGLMALTDSAAAAFRNHVLELSNDRAFTKGNLPAASEAASALGQNAAQLRTAIEPAQSAALDEMRKVLPQSKNDPWNFFNRAKDDLLTAEESRAAMGWGRLHTARNQLGSVANDVDLGYWRNNSEILANKGVNIGQINGFAGGGKDFDDLVAKYNASNATFSRLADQNILERTASRRDGFRDGVGAAVIGQLGNYAMDRLMFSDVKPTTQGEVVDTVANLGIMLTNRFGMLPKAAAIMGVHAAIKLWERNEHAEK